MRLVLLINLGLIGLAAAVPNDVLLWQSYIFYGLQAIALLGYLLPRTLYLKNIFLPSYFVLVYFLVNLTFGGYLVPRDFGWNKDFAETVRSIRDYNIIVPYFLIANFVLFFLTQRALISLNRISNGCLPYQEGSARRSGISGLGVDAIYLGLFFVVSFFDVYSAFSFQLAIMIAHFTRLGMYRSRFRFAYYGAYFAVLLAVSFENKREIAMVLFLLLFIEAYFGRIALRFRPVSLMIYASTAAAFLGLVMAASILRGYGDIQAGSVIGAILLIPEYMASSIFMDAIVDNLELNYNYGVAVTAVSLVLNGRLEYQLGASIVKILFLPIPREVFPYKPESVMQIFTREYAPAWWVEDGSMPVMSASEMFVNFNYLGLFVFGLIWFLINKLFVEYHLCRKTSLKAYSCLFLFITVLMFARGSGVEQYILYYLVALPFLLLVTVSAGPREQRGMVHSSSKVMI